LPLCTRTEVHELVGEHAHARELSQLAVEPVSHGRPDPREKRVHPHGLRHGWAPAQVQAGTSLNAIQQLLGHRSLHTTSVYLQHIAPAAAVAEATAKTAHLAVAP
jgi:site-specific recombinase XerD